MAASPAHRFGQIIGEVLEAAVGPLLRELAERHGLYLDCKGKRPARRGLKVSWTDGFGNTHDLDFVLERNGAAGRIGTPVALIEAAWRSYTKHSRNKAQEIQGAVLPVAAAHSKVAPFTGVVLAGVFTQGAVSQLRSLGFHVLYFEHGQVCRAFATARIDAAFAEETPDEVIAQRVAAWMRLSAARKARVASALIEAGRAEVDAFVAELEATITRVVTMVRVLPVHGLVSEHPSAEAAIEYIVGYGIRRDLPPIVRFEIEVRFSNGDRITAEFGEKAPAVAFLRDFSVADLRLANPRPAKQ